MLSTGFVGSVYWSTKQLPAPYPLPFGSSLSAFWLVLRNDGFSASLGRSFVLGVLARRDSSLGYQLPPCFPVTLVSQSCQFRLWGTCCHHNTCGKGLSFLGYLLAPLWLLSYKVHLGFLKSHLFLVPFYFIPCGGELFERKRITG